MNGTYFPPIRPIHIEDHPAEDDPDDQFDTYIDQHAQEAA